MGEKCAGRRHETNKVSFARCAMLRRRALVTVLQPSLASMYTLYDQFTTARAAGSVNATNAEPVGGARTVTDTNSKISITGGVLDFATGGNSFGDPAVWYGLITRTLGRLL